MAVAISITFPIPIAVPIAVRRHAVVGRPAGGGVASATSVPVRAEEWGEPGVGERGRVGGGMGGLPPHLSLPLPLSERGELRAEHWLSGGVCAANQRVVVVIRHLDIYIYIYRKDY
jgi:hypothetical protein